MTFDELKALIQDDLVDERVTDAQLQSAIQTCIAFYSRTGFYFNQMLFSFTASPGVSDYINPTLPDIFSIANVTWLGSDGVVYTLVPYKQEDITNNLLTNSTLAAPRGYTYYNKTFKVYPAPSVSGTITVQGFKKFPALMAGNDSNDWLVEAAELIRHGAKRRIALTVFQDRDMAAGFGILEREEYDFILAETRKRDPVVTLNTPTDMVQMVNPPTYDIRTG